VQVSRPEGAPPPGAKDVGYWEERHSADAGPLSLRNEGPPKVEES